MQNLYDLIGRLLFPRQQDWEQRRSAKTVIFTLAFTFVLGLFMAELIRLMYYHKK